VVVGVVAAGAIVASSGDPQSFPGDAPEATVQRFVRGLVEGDDDRALSALDGDLAERCRDDVAERRFGTPARVVLEGAQIDGTQAIVRIAVTDRRGGGLLDRDEFHGIERVDLRRGGEGWRISDVPWPLYSCSDEPQP
jgi:hypothetical protein